jgi:hypothetical protein
MPGVRNRGCANRGGFDFLWNYFYNSRNKTTENVNGHRKPV